MTVYNALTGRIPSEIGNASALQHLFLGEWASIEHVKKMFNPVQLSHTFPLLLHSFRMTAQNVLTGPIPSEVGKASTLQYLTMCEWASINRVTKKCLPVRMSHTFLVLLNFSSRMIDGNALTGPIPTEIGNLSALGYVNLCECYYASFFIHPPREETVSSCPIVSHFSFPAGRFTPNDSQQRVVWSDS
jgi:hypothetical protein